MIKKLLFIITLVITTSIYAQDYSSIEVIGTAINGNWTQAKEMNTTDGVHYSINNITLQSGELKFRENNSWDTNWGKSSNEVGVYADCFNIPDCNDYFELSGAPAIPDGDNIEIHGGAFDIVFNQNDLSYKISTAVPSYPKISLFGSATENKDIYLTTTDGENYFLHNVILWPGEFQIRQDNGNGNAWGPENNGDGFACTLAMTGTNSCFGGGTAQINNHFPMYYQGQYTIKFNRLTQFYTIDGGDLSTKVYLVGYNVIRGDKVELKQESLSVYKNERVEITNTNGVHFETQSAPSPEVFTIGDSTFPTGLTKPGDTKIPATPGVYSVTYDTGKDQYEFTFIEDLVCLGWLQGSISGSALEESIVLGFLGGDSFKKEDVKLKDGNLIFHHVNGCQVSTFECVPGKEHLTYGELVDNGNPLILDVDEDYTYDITFKPYSKKYIVERHLSTKKHLEIGKKQYFNNPVTNGQLDLSMAADTQIFDLNGRLLLTQQNSSYIDVSSLAKGLYLLSLNGKTSKKLIIQ